MSLGPASRVREQDGWLWLEPHPRSLAARRFMLGTGAALVLLGLVAVVALLPPVLGAAAVVAGGGVMAWAFYRWWRVAWARVGASELGVMLQGGGRSEVYGWEAVEAVRLRPLARGRVDVVVRLDDGEAAARAGFGRAAAESWGARAARLAPPDIAWEH